MAILSLVLFVVFFVLLVSRFPPVSDPRGLSPQRIEAVSGHNVWMTTAGSSVRFKEFRSSFKSWNDLFAEAAAFATTLGPERLISISHSEDQSKGVVAVWYWGNPEDPED